VEPSAAKPQPNPKSWQEDGWQEDKDRKIEDRKMSLFGFSCLFS
jgi:hypothetical protein